MPYAATPAASRALLIGAGHFTHGADFERLDAAHRNIQVLRDALTAPQTGLLRPSGVRLLTDPPDRDTVLRAIDGAQKRSTDLLLVYYAGHGFHNLDTGELYLAVRESSLDRPGLTGLSVADLMAQLSTGRSRRVVLILDCCFSGNFPLDLLPDGRAVSLITSSGFNALVSPGEVAGAPSPFTAALAEVLREGVSPDEYVTVQSLGARLRELAEDKENTAQPFPYHPREISTSGGADTVLSLALGTTRVPVEQQLRRAARRAVGLVPPPRALWHPALPNRVLSVGMGLVLLAGGITGYLYATREDPCPPPLELRMATAPEEVAPMSELVEEFEKSGADHADNGRARDCRTARITVYGTGLDALGSAFAHAGDWGGGARGALADVGPQPDLWAAQSSAEVELIKGGLSGLGGQQRETFFSTARMAGDRPVLVLTDAARKRLGLKDTDGTVGTTDWPRLRAALKREDGERLRLLRPNPAVSGVGLGHALGMYARERVTDQPFTYSEGVLDDQAIRQLETEVISQARSVSDAGQALCELRTAARNGTGDEADAPAGALVTGRQAQLLIDGEPLGGQCPGGSPPAAPSDFQRYELRGVPRLDYPLVSVRWQAADRRARDAAIAAFRSWLKSPAGRGEVEAAGYERQATLGVDIGGTELDDRLDSFRAAHPDLRLTVLFDVSASMRERGRFEAAREAVEESLGRLGAKDRFALRTYPAGKDGGGTAEVTEGWREPGAGLGLERSALRPEGQRQADLLEAVREATEGGPEDGTQHAVLLVTDGDYLKGEPPRTSQLRALGRELHRRGIPVVVASMRPYGCADSKAAPHEPGALAHASGGACAALSGDLPAQLSRAVAALTEGKGR
ncbi:solute-binding protein [Streptomyces sp. A7024]|uniref:Solute-binding protein n=1 Tax=Streptomyces coryli TaxID=1128680 RepID=A0A6G4U4I1_9ACTN|nr:caspase family protein [Streptomyces coryli]NGN67149.1 solute-binding protein [Streptomyces coryli]